MQPEEEKGSQKEQEEIQEAKDTRAMLCEREIYSEERSNEAALEFTRLEVQIAVVLFGVIGVYLNSKNPALDSKDIRISLILSIFLLIGSLALGLLHLKVIEKFWDIQSGKRELRIKEFTKVVRGGVSFKEALAFEEGTKLGGGHMVGIPKWTWIIQSVLLGISILIISVISIFFVIAM